MLWLFICGRFIKTVTALISQGCIKVSHHKLGNFKNSLKSVVSQFQRLQSNVNMLAVSARLTLGRASLASFYLLVLTSILFILPWRCTTLLLWLHIVFSLFLLKAFLILKIRTPDTWNIMHRNGNDFTLCSPITGAGNRTVTGDGALKEGCDHKVPLLWMGLCASWKQLDGGSSALAFLSLTMWGNSISLFHA